MDVENLHIELLEPESFEAELFEIACAIDG
jgi:hypothetical protein